MSSTLRTRVLTLSRPQDSGVLRGRAPRREDRGGGGAAAGRLRGGQLPVDEPRAAGGHAPLYPYHTKHALLYTFIHTTLS